MSGRRGLRRRLNRWRFRALRAVLARTQVGRALMFVEWSNGFNLGSRLASPPDPECERCHLEAASPEKFRCADHSMRAAA